MFFRTGYNYDADKASEETGLVCDPDEGLTKQSFKDEADINVLVERFGITGEMPTSLRMPLSGDFNGVSDFQEAMQLVVQAEEQFATLPGALRERFRHDPGQLMAFLEDEGNREEAIKLGLLNPPPEVPRNEVVEAIDKLAERIVPQAAG